MQWSLSTRLQPTLTFNILNIITDVGEGVETGIVDNWELDGSDITIFFTNKPVIFALIAVLFVIILMYLAFKKR